MAWPICVLAESPRSLDAGLDKSGDGNTLQDTVVDESAIDPPDTAQSHEVERLRYVLDEYRRILDERQEAYAELYGTEQWLRYEWGKRGEALDRVNALLDARAEEHAEFLRKVETGEIIMMDRAIGPVQVYVRDVRAAIGDTT